MATSIGWGPDVRAARPDSSSGENVLRATLQNGLRVVIVRNTLAPVVATVVNYHVGSDEDPAGFPGMAHAQEHMMFRGSTGLSADQLADVTAAMGGMFDADTQQTVTQYFLTVPSEDLDVALHIEAVRMRDVLDSETLWNQERGAIEQEVAQDLSNPEYVSYTKLQEKLFAGTPYAEDGLGTIASFDKMTGKALKRFYRDWYAPNNALLVIAGNVEPRAALADVKKIFGDLPTVKTPERADIRFKPVKAETLRFDTDRPYGTVLLSFRMPGYDSPDFAAAQVLADVLDSQRGALYSLVVEGKALSADFSLDELPKAGIGYAEATVPKGNDGSEVIKDIKNILADAAMHGVPADLVEAAKRREAAGAEFQKNSVSGLAMAWSQALAVEGRHSPKDDVEAIERVSPADVNRVARTYLKPDTGIVVVLTPQSSGQPISSNSFGGKESFSPKQVQPVSLPKWAQKAVERVSIPPSTVDPVVTIFPNGLRLIVQPESISNTVVVYGRIKTEPLLETPEGKDGVSDVLDQLFSFGTTSLDRVAFQKALDDIGATESAGESFSLEVTADRFERGLQLLADNELHPALPEAAFKIIQKQSVAAVAGQLQSPDYLAGRALRAALYPRKDPTQREAKPATLLSLTLKDVGNYYRTVYRPDLTTIVVIGKTTPEKARALVEKYFGDWNAAGPKPETLLPPVPPNRAASTFIPNASRVQDEVTLAETLGLNRFDPDYYALELGNHVLGGAFYATRLYRDLRERAGLVYFVSSSFDIGKTRSLYLSDYACDPSNVAKVRAVIERELEEMRSKPVTRAELRRAKALLLREIPLSESSVDGVASGLISRAIHDLPLDEPTRAARIYAKLSAGRVEAAFRKWVRPDDLVQVTEGPKLR